MLVVTRQFMVRHNLMFGLLIFSILSPFVVGNSFAETNHSIQLDDSECGIEYFSPAIWASYTRAADLDSYSYEDLSLVNQWVFTLNSGYCSLEKQVIDSLANKIDAELISTAGKLDDSWIIKFNHNDFNQVIEDLSLIHI